VGDLDGDGRDEWAVGAFLANDMGEVVVVSGADGSLVHAFAGTQVGDQYGRALAAVGDVDGDLIPDLLIGAPQTLAFDGGYIEVRSGADGSLLRSISGFPLGDDFGFAVAGLGDIDGDDRGDFAVGSPRADDTESNVGLVRVYSGGPPVPALLHTFVGDDEDQRLGGALADAGDVDGDGTRDLIAGTSAQNDPGQDFARVWSGDDFSVLHTFLADGSTQYLGSAVGGAGDVDRDGYADLLAGGWGYDGGSTDVGIARCYSGDTGAVLYEWTGDEFGDWLGFAVAGVGDVDADGWPDVALGAPRPYPPVDVPGLVHVRSGRDGTLIQTHVGADEDDQFGYALAALGDANGDGFDDLVAGGPGGVGENGYAFVHTSRGLQRPPLLAVLGSTATESLGFAVDGGADLDGDGVPDLVAGGPGLSGDVGVIRAISGADGSQLWSVSGGGTGGDFGERLTFTDDIDDDGVADVATVGLGDPSGHIGFLYSGADGAFIRGFSPAGMSGFGSGLAAVGDLDGDGYGDLAFGAGPCCGDWVGNVAIHSSRTGLRVLELVGPTSTNTQYGSEGLCDAGDVDGDGVSDILVGDTSYDDEPGQEGGSGSAFLHSGADGSVLRVITGLAFVERMGNVCAPFTDIDGDTVPDLLIGARGQANFGGVDGRVRAISGADGSVLFTTLPVASDGPWADSLANIGDADGDGTPDFAVGDLSDVEGGYFAGRVDLFSGADGSHITSLIGPNTTGYTSFGRAIAGAGDLDGDGRGDVVVGKPTTLVAALGAEGEVEVHSSRPAPWAPLGQAKAGSHGTPNLWAEGELLGGDPLDVHLTGTLPSTIATLVLGLTPLELPFKGGVLVPMPDILLAFPTDADGAVHVPTVWPLGLPAGAQLWVQGWIPDAGVPKNIAATNAIVATTP
jgi:hypothetical protein